MALIPGEQFAGYEILAELGRGGMGAVYQARQVSLQRIVALKILPPHLATEKDHVARFQSEAVSAANLNHPNIVHIYAAGEFSGIEYIAMEFVEGETIQQRLRRCGRLPLTEALDIAYHIAVALDHAWQSAQLIHRDVKPDNIFLAHNGTVKLGDFGLAKILREGASSQTVTGFIVGSPHFISPEQAHGQRDIDPRADIYSLGCTLHYMMTGRTVFEGPDFMSIMYKHVNEPPNPIHTLLPNCPAVVNRLIVRMLAKNRDERHQNYAELIEELVAARTDAALWEASDDRQRRKMAVELPPKNSRRVYVFAALVTLLAALSIGYAKRAYRTAAPTPSITLADPSDRRDFVQTVEKLPPSEKVERVLAKLRELNPEFTGKGKYTVEGDVITDLSLPSMGLKNLWPLVALKHLRVLHIPGDIENKRHSDLSDLAALAELPDLEELDCSWTSVENLEPLAKLPLNTLFCAETRVNNLAPLSKLSLADLDISGTSVSDLAPLKGMPIMSLRLKGSRVRELGALRGAPVKSVYADMKVLRAQADVVRSWPRLEEVDGAPVPRELRGKEVKWVK